jgi:hypothetical protein
MLTKLIHPRTGAIALGVRKDGRPIWPITGADGRGEGNGTGRVANPSPMLARLYEERQQCIDFVDQTVAGANVEGQARDLSASEQESLTRTRERITAIDAQITPLEEFEQLRSAGNQANLHFRPTGPASPSAGNGLGARTEPRPYSYATPGDVIVDMCRAAPHGTSPFGATADPDARERLLSAGVLYAGSNDDDVRRAKDAAQRLAADQRQAILQGGRPDAQIRATQVTADTPGVLPVPIIGDIMSDVDGSRPFITTVGAKSLAFAGETFKRPVITQHTAVGKQTVQATTTGVGSQRLIIGSVTFTKETWGGYLDVSRQDIDWTSPAAWNAILSDLEEQYGLQTENAAADAFATAVTQNVEVVGAAGIPGGGDLKAWLTAMYSAASLVYAGAGRLPDAIWTSLDVWAGLGPLIDSLAAMQKNPGNSSLATFSGMLADLPRYVVPSFAAGTMILGAKKWTEVYEERIGLLQAVLPSAFGVQVAYGGYVAYNTLKANAFAKVVNVAA